MKSTVQYTIRQVPRRVDAALRKRSQKSRRSLNEEALQALSRGLGVEGEKVLHYDLDSLAGTWQEDSAFDTAIEAQDQVDRKLWRR